MFCVDSVKSLIRYYDIFKRKKLAGEHNLNIATIFSYTANEEEKNHNGIDEEDFDFTNAKINPHTRDILEEYIQEYNQTFGTNYSTRDSILFYNYYKDIANRVKNKQIDILFVVNMFLTGFDSKTLNTLFVDKNLRHHGLIQAYSRTNRILGEKKSQGNIVVFRNLKKATDDAIALFSNKEAKEIIIMQPYEKYVKDINQAYDKLIQLVPTFESVDNLYSEDEELEFIKAFREIIRLKNVISSYVDFTFEDIKLDEQEFENYKSKYLDLYDKTREVKEKTSILDEVDFELELIHRDDITVTYILALLAKLKATTLEEKERKQKEILDLVAGETKLRSKRELIEKFIIENLPLIQPENIEEDYNTFMDVEKQKAFTKFVEDENLNPDKLKKLTEDYLFSQRPPTKQEVVEVLEIQPSILQRSTVGDTILKKFLNFVNTFFND
jgi:type I restriction enzyme R subunit